MSRHSAQPRETSPLLSGSQRSDHAEAPNQHSPSGEADTALVDEPPTAKKLVIMLSLWLGVFFAALDTTVVATLISPISSSLNSLSLLSYLATGYLIANSACQPLSGKLTDIFSRRKGLVFSNIFFATGTLICGLAPNAEILILGRVVAGCGGGKTLITM